MTSHSITALGADQTVLLRALDEIFENRGLSIGATPMIMPALLDVESLARLDFYENFPHQALVVSALDLDKHGEHTGRQQRSAFSSEDLEPARLALPSAACFAVYLHFAGQQVAEGTKVTVLGRCFRREDHYEPLRRLLSFHMREIVAIGTQEYVEEHLAETGRWIAELAGRLGLRFSQRAATDPFYDRGGQRALLQRLAPVKQEFVVDDLAIASLNVHRNFFGERCGITFADTGKPVFTACAAFGLERWLAVLYHKYGSWQAATDAVTTLGSETSTRDRVLN